MSAVAGDRPLQLAAIAEVDRHLRHGAHALPVQDKILAERFGNLVVRVQRRAEEPAVGTGEILVQVAQHPQTQDRLAAGASRIEGLVQIGVPKEPRPRAIALHADLVDDFVQLGDSGRHVLDDSRFLFRPVRLAAQFVHRLFHLIAELQQPLERFRPVRPQFVDRRRAIGIAGNGFEDMNLQWRAAGRCAADPGKGNARRQHRNKYASHDRFSCKRFAEGVSFTSTDSRSETPPGV